MKNHHIRFFFLLFTSLAWTPSLRAALVSTVDVNVGLSSLNVKAENYSKTLASTSAMEINYVLKHAVASAAYVISFTEMFRGNGKDLPYSLLSFGARYYTSGFNGSRLLLDQGVSAKVWRATPFIGLHVGMANVSIDDFNASIIDISPRMGVELPVTASLLGQAQLVLQSGSAAGSGSQSTISYTGISAYLGIVIVDF